MILLAALAATPPTASATEPDWGRLADLDTGRAVPGPAGWLNWCFGKMERCAPARTAAPPTVPATPELLGLLDRVQQEVNRTVRPRAEPAGQDLWQVATVEGDCEDFALAKLRRLEAAGVPHGVARLATLQLPSGEGHAVLTVDTDRGTLVLDNLQPGVTPLHALRYAWRSVEGVDDSLLWRELASSPPARDDPRGIVSVPAPDQPRWPRIGATRQYIPSSPALNRLPASSRESASLPERAPDRSPVEPTLAVGWPMPAAICAPSALPGSTEWGYWSRNSAIAAAVPVDRADR